MCVCVSAHTHTKGIRRLVASGENLQSVGFLRKCDRLERLDLSRNFLWGRLDGMQKCKVCVMCGGVCSDGERVRVTLTLTLTLTLTHSF